MLENTLQHPNYPTHSSQSSLSPRLVRDRLRHMVRHLAAPLRAPGTVWKVGERLKSKILMSKILMLSKILGDLG